jgi:hypothetical protein
MGDSTKLPTHRAFTVLPRKGDDGKDDNFWLNIGSVFAHADGRGFNIVLEALPIDGKLVLREIKEPEPQPERKSYKR